MASSRLKYETKSTDAKDASDQPNRTERLPNRPKSGGAAYGSAEWLRLMAEDLRLRG